jgi:hypothetical protein
MQREAEINDTRKLTVTAGVECCLLHLPFAGRAGVGR